jgi:hypothetical protein
VKFRGIFVALCLLLSSSLPTAQASETIEKSPSAFFDAALPEVGARGILFQENPEAVNTVGFTRFSHIPKFNSDGSINPSNFWNFKLCSSLNDTKCEVKAGYTAEERLFLGKCIDQTELGCIESLRIKVGSGSFVELEYVGPAYEGVQDIAESRYYGVPRSSSPAIFKDSSAQLYIVRAGMFVSITANNPISQKMYVDVYPVNKVPDSSIGAPKAADFRIPDSGLNIVTVENVRPTCLAVTVGYCFKQAKLQDLPTVELKLRLPKSIGGWFKGRLSSPEMNVVKLNDDSNLLTVTGKYVAMPIMGGWVKYDDLPSDFIMKLYPSGGYPDNRNQTLGLYADASQGARAFEEFTAWAPYFKDRALTTIDTWSFGTNFSSSGNPCLRSTASVAGIVTTNASVYSSEPPTWDPATSTLDYKVASPHFNAQGEENVGTYTLAISNDVLKCLYGLKQLPAVATVSIIYGDTTTNVGTVAVGAKDGWSHFSVDGFHYSTPTIRVKFQEPVAVKPSAPPTPIAAPSTQPLKVQWCAKGNAKKKITALNPACPKGYKKIAAPLAR